MHFSQRAQSFFQSQPSPSGVYTASIAPSKLSIWEISSLEIIHEFPLPSGLVATWFVWSPSSHRILVGSTEILCIYSTSKKSRHFSITIKNTTGSLVRACFVSFGGNDSEILIVHDFGLKLSIFNLITSQWVDLVSPKIYGPRVVSRGFSYRPSTGNLTLLSRNAGRDIVSIHGRDTLDVIRSWRVDTIDAQGLCWTPDGKWLLVYESASHGHKLVVYTADGQLYKTWQGPTDTSEVDEISMIGFGLGIKLILSCPDSTNLAVSDYGAIVTVLQMPYFTPIMSLKHSTIVLPNETNFCMKQKNYQIVACTESNELTRYEVWQEQAEQSQPINQHRFVLAVAETCLPSLSAANEAEEMVKTGVNLMCFDKSGIFLATTTEECPSTMWIWDMRKKISRAILILYREIKKIIWHPTLDGYVMVHGERDRAHSLIYLWHPSWHAPQAINLSAHLESGEAVGKTVIRWIQDDSFFEPSIFYSDSQDCLLISLRSSFGAKERPYEERGYAVTKIRPIMEKERKENKEEKWIDEDDKDDKDEENEENEKEEDDETLCESEGSEILEDTFHFRKKSQRSQDSEL